MGLEDAWAPLVLAERFDLHDRVVALVLAPLAATVVEGPQAGELPVHHHAHAGLDPRALVALDIEGAQLAEPLSRERAGEGLEALAIRPHGAPALVRLGPLHELILRLVEAEILPLPADAGFALEDPGTLHAVYLPRDGPVDTLADPDHVTLALVHEVEPPGVAAKVDAITASGHHPPPSNWLRLGTVERERRRASGSPLAAAPTRRHAERHRRGRHRRVRES